MRKPWFWFRTRVQDSLDRVESRGGMRGYGQPGLPVHLYPPPSHCSSVCLLFEEKERMTSEGLCPVSKDG